jgi:hypothetical protein
VIKRDFIMLKSLVTLVRNFFAPSTVMAESQPTEVEYYSVDVKKKLYRRIFDGKHRPAYSPLKTKRLINQAAFILTWEKCYLTLTPVGGGEVISQFDGGDMWPPIEALNKQIIDCVGSNAGKLTVVMHETLYE